MTLWKDSFQSLCERMMRESQTSCSLPNDGGLVQLVSNEQCPKLHRGRILIAEEMEYGMIYHRVDASYCGDCREIFRYIEGVNFAPSSQKRFLPVLRNKLIDDPELLSSVKPAGKCPECACTIYMFHADLGMLDYYDNFWQVCINKDCAWPGSHWEEYTMAGQET